MIVKSLMLMCFMMMANCSGGDTGGGNKQPSEPPVLIEQYLVGNPFMPNFVESWKMGLLREGYSELEMPFAEGLVTDRRKVLIEWKKALDGGVCTLKLEVTIQGDFVSSSSTCQAFQ